LSVVSIYRYVDLSVTFEFIISCWPVLCHADYNLVNILLRLSVEGPLCKQRKNSGDVLYSPQL